MSLVKTVLKFAAPLPKLEGFERFLFIGPHPDDIEIGAGATAAKLAAKGKKICFLICIDGRYGGEYAAPEELIEIRRREAIASARALGVEDVRFLNLCDGGFYEKKDMLSGIASVIGDFKPEVIFAPDPDVSSECHIDHLNTGNCAKELAEFAPYKNIMARYGVDDAPVQALALYMTAKPSRYVNTTGFLEKQLSAVFDNHLSQFSKGSSEAASISLYLKLRAYNYGIHAFCKTAEGFRVLGTTHMHCLPEAGK